jgi:hypothetical protein
MSKKIGRNSSPGIEATKGKSFRERFAEKSGKIGLVYSNIDELIAALKFAAQASGEHLAIVDDPYGDNGLTGKSTRIFQLISALAVELEQLRHELTAPPTDDGTPGELLKELMLNLPRKRGAPENIRARRVKKIIGAAVLVLRQDLGCKTRNAAIREVQALVQSVGLTFNVKTVADWYAAVEHDDLHLWALRVTSGLPPFNPAETMAERRRRLLQSAARMIEMAG